MSTGALDQMKQRARAGWAAGDYDQMADQIWDVGDDLVDRVGVGEGEAVLDVACGTGNAAIPAAKAGGRVVGLDLTPELFDAGRARAAHAGVALEWVEGDAEALPFEDESFDVVLSSFGCMWVPRHEVCAREIARVLRRGGKLGLTNWTPEGEFGVLGATMARYMPPLPDFAGEPRLWGSEDHVRGLFAGTGVELEFERKTTNFEYDSVDAGLESMETKLGTLVKARELLEPQGRWQELHEEIRAWFVAGNVARDGTLLMPQEYLLTLGRKT